MVSGTSPVFETVHRGHVARPRRVGRHRVERGRKGQQRAGDGRADALEVREADVAVGQRAAVVLLVVVADAVGGGGEDRLEVDLTRAGGHVRGGARVRDAGAVLDVEQLDARLVVRLVDERRGLRAGDVVQRVRGPLDVDLGHHVARVGALHDDVDRRLQHAVVDVLVVELLLVVVEVHRADAGLDRALAEPVERLDGGERVGVAADARGGEAARADVVGAEDLRRGEAGVPVRLAHVAVPATGVQAVGVEHRAVGRQARDVGARREAGMAEQLDVGHAPQAQEVEQDPEAIRAAVLCRRLRAALGALRAPDDDRARQRRRRGGRLVVARLTTAVVDEAAVVEQLDAHLACLDAVADAIPEGGLVGPDIGLGANGDQEDGAGGGSSRASDRTPSQCPHSSPPLRGAARRTVDWVPPAQSEPNPCSDASQPTFVEDGTKRRSTN